MIVQRFGDNYINGIKVYVLTAALKAEGIGMLTTLYRFIGAGVGVTSTTFKHYAPSATKPKPNEMQQLTETKTLSQIVAEAEERIANGEVRRFPSYQTFAAYVRFIVRSKSDYVRKRGLFRRMEKKYKRLPKMGKMRYDQLSDALEDWEDEQMRISLANDPEFQALCADL